MGEKNSEFYINELFRVDYDDYPLGTALRVVGFWSSWKEAHQWGWDNHPGAGKAWQVRKVEKVNEGTN